MQQLVIAGVPIAYLDEGQGPPVVLAHCSSASHRMWSALIREFAPSHRVLAPDLIGYGQSGRWPPERPYQPDADVRLLMALAQKAGTPVHFVGHSYGAATALEAARMLGGGVRGMTLIEPVSFHLLKAGGYEAELRSVERAAARVKAAMAAGDRQRAAAAFMGFWIGRLRWWLAPKKLKGPVTETVDKVALEFAAIEGQTAVSLAPYQAITAPTLLIYGSATRKPARAVARLLERSLPHARITAIRGAGHMSPFTHRDRINALIMDHIREAERHKAELQNLERMSMSEQS
jgi:lipase